MTSMLNEWTEDNLVLENEEDSLEGRKERNGERTGS